MVSNHFKQIAISPENYEALKKLGSMGSTFDSVLTEVLKKLQVTGDKAH